MGERQGPVERVELGRMSSALSGRKILVTGHTGFNGSWLSLWLSSLGAEVVGLSLDPPSEPSLFKAIDLARRMRSLRGDVTDFDHLRRVFGDEQPEIVFHLAAQPIVRRSYREPRATFETNVMGTVNVLEAARLTESVRSVVNVTSDKCYENREWTKGYRETDGLGGNDPYSSSKACAELVTAAYLKSFFSGDGGSRPVLALASVRAGNIIGGGDWGEDRLIPDCVRALSRGEPVHLRYPRAVRPWQHVLDALSGLLVIGEKLLDEGVRYAGAWNLGPSGETLWTVEQVVRRVCSLWGGGEYRMAEGPHALETNLLILDCSKALRLLGWKARLSTELAIEKTVAWYRHFYSGAGPRDLERLCEDQIREAEALRRIDHARAGSEAT